MRRSVATPPIRLTLKADGPPDLDIGASKRPDAGPELPVHRPLAGHACGDAVEPRRGVTPAGSYAWRRRGPSARARQDGALAARIQASFAASHVIYGAPRIHAELRQAQGLRVGRKRVARLMRTLGIAGVSRRRAWRPTTIRDPGAAPAPDLVQRRFAADRPNQLWVADLTYILTAEGWLYLAVVVDAAGPAAGSVAPSPR